MKTLTSSLYFLALIAVCVQGFAQAATEPARIITSKAGLAAHRQTIEPQKAPEKKDLPPNSAADQRAKRGTDLRLALMLQSSHLNTSSGNSNLKTQGGIAHVADMSTPEPLPEHQLNVKERQEMRELLRQQRSKLQGGPQN